MRLLCVVGTRPEAIKMAPVIAALRADPRFACRVCASGQHREMLRQALACFDIAPDFDLDVMTDNQALNGLASALFQRLDATLAQEAPDRVLVHGDTTTAMAAAMAAFHRGLPVGHVEAGLRTGDLARPWPEEMNRRVIDVVSRDLFAPTPAARAALRREALAGRIVVTGNTVVDALQLAVARLDADPSLRAPQLAELPAGRPLVLVTCHRRENFGGALERIAEALRDLARSGFEVVLPLHRNPAVRSVFEPRLSGVAHVHLIAPLGYLPFVDLLRRAAVVLTDSGGVQEEAASLGKPLLVMRDVTERPEAMETQGLQLVGCERERIVAAVQAAARGGSVRPASRVISSPYGDGCAARRIVASLAGDACEEFAPPAAAGRPQRREFAA